MLWRDFLRRHVFDYEQSPGEAIPFFSSEGIKLAFDIVRNYGLGLLVFTGAMEFARFVDPILRVKAPVDAWLIGLSLKWFLYSLGFFLLGLNVLYATRFFERTPFYRARAHKLRWALLSVAICTGIGAALAFAIYFARLHAT